MRFPQGFVAFAICAAALTAAQAQTASFVPEQHGPGTAPAPMSFSFDALHGQIAASGVQLKPMSTKRAAGLAPTTGTIQVTINVKIVSGFQSGTTYHCSLYAVGGAIDPATLQIDGGIETAATFAVPSGPGTVACTMTIPYEWTLPSGRGTDSGVILAFGVGAINPQGEAQRSTLQVDGIEALPANGATDKFVFDVTL